MILSANHPKISISAALVANIAVLTLVVGTLCAWLVTTLGTQYIHQHESVRLAEVGRNIAGAMSHALAERESEVRGIRDLFERELATASGSQKREIMDRVRAYRQHFSWLGIVATGGIIELGTDGLLEGVSVAGRNWFEGAMRSPVYFGNVHPAKLLESHIRNPDGAPLYLLDIAFPLHDAAGQVTGVLGSHFNWKMIEEVVNQVAKNFDGAAHLSAAIVDGNGDILYDTQGVTGNVGNLLPRAATNQMIKARWLNDTDDHFISLVQLPARDTFDGFGWRVIVRESALVVGAEIAQMNWQVIGISLFVGLIFSLLGLFAVRLIVRPLRDLVTDLGNFGDTEVLPAPRKISHISEIANLHGAFLAMAARVSAHGEMLRETQAEVVQALGRAGEFRDNETGNHVMRMSVCCQRLAELAGKNSREAESIRMASQMHDIGKIGIPDQILLKPGKYNENERAIMEEHCQIGVRILTGVDAPLTVMARTIALTHHEKWDGTGYPNRLAGTDIPFEGRVTAICDVFDALLSSRPYKDAWTLERVTAFFRDQSGRHFDPSLMELFLAHLDEFVRLRNQFSD